MDYELLGNIATPVGTLVLVLVGLFVVHKWVLKAHTASTGKKFRNQMIMLALSSAGAVTVIVALPLGVEQRGQILSLLGIVLSVGVALSSTTLLGNAMAGLMIRAVRAFRLGEFIEVGDHFGRVSDMGLLHVEIQTEDRDLKTLPNLLLVTHAVKRIRPSGTILSARVSLGYDLDPARIQRLLVQAAETVELKDPFVRVTALGDYSVTYKVAGLLEETPKLLAKRSALYVAMMHSLHSDGVEIVSPTFRNTRMVESEQRFIPPAPEKSTAAIPESSHETVVFDKAEEAASLESLRVAATNLKHEKETLEKAMKDHDGDQYQKDETELVRLDRQLERLSKLIDARESQAADKD